MYGAARWRACSAVLGLLAAGFVPDPVSAQPATALDLADAAVQAGAFGRVWGSAGNGFRGLPVAGGSDCDGDGFEDVAFAAMLASPPGRPGAGLVYLVFGHGDTRLRVDTAEEHRGVLFIWGDTDSEAAGSELWMDDVTGDGIGDLLIARQNHSPDPATRPGVGALTILVGGAPLRARAQAYEVLDLRFPPPDLTLTTLIGAEDVDRLGIWMRTGDVTGDGIADIVVGADQEDAGGETNRGAAYVVRGGPHLAINQTIDLADFGQTALAGNLAKLTPPVGSAGHHFGATCQIADLDGNGRGEVLVAAALNRSGAGIQAAGAPAGSAQSVGGSVDGTVYIAWDDNFSGVWPAGFSFDIGAPPGTHTIIDGADVDRDFGEELLGGLDYDGDQCPDLFIGDLTGDASPGGNRFNSGVGYVLYNAAALRGLQFDMGAPPAWLTTSVFLGAGSGHIAADTATHGDFDNDGIADLSFSSPHASPLGRSSAGTIHVFFGRSGPWPATIDLAALPPPSVMRITEIYGANGAASGDLGDTLSYSAAPADVDGDGRTDLVTNEMVGNGLAPASVDVGNLIVIGGSLLTGTPQIPALPAWAFPLLVTALGLAARRALPRR
jgi:hypothetical protein